MSTELLNVSLVFPFELFCYLLTSALQLLLWPRLRPPKALYAFTF